MKHGKNTKMKFLNNPNSQKKKFDLLVQSREGYLREKNLGSAQLCCNPLKDDIISVS